jgi:rhamnosyltransferase
MSEGHSRETVRPESMASSICAVMVTFFPDSGAVERARLIVHQVGAVIVVDNGSGPEHEDILHTLSRIPRLTLLQNDTNVGLATALNQGVRWAKNHGFEWVLLFDQDSTPLDSMVSELSHICLALGREASTTLIGSNFVDVNSGRAWLNSPDDPNRSWVDTKTMTTSGTLMPISAFHTLGPFRSDLFVDLVDMEYSLRAKSRGFSVVASVRPLMLHTVGAKKRRRLLWRTVWPSNHPPQRRYLMARNSVLLIREYGARDPTWALATVSALVKSLILVLLYEDSRLSKLSSTGRGIIAGLRRSTVHDATEPPTVGVVEDAPRLPR